MIKINEDLSLNVKDSPMFEGDVTFNSLLPESCILICKIKYNDVEITEPVNYLGQGKSKSYFSLPESILLTTEVKVNIGVFNGEEFVYGEPSALRVNQKKISSKIRNKDEIKSLAHRIAEFERQLLIHTKQLVQPELPPLNKDIVKKGMVLTIIDDDGRSAFMFPFYDIIKEVNGIKAENQRLLLRAEDIPIGSTNLDATMKKFLAWQEESTKNYNKLIETLSTLIGDFSKLKSEFIDYKNKDLF